DIFAHGDIGCYSMSFLPPFGEMHNLTAMSLGGAAGSGMDPFVTNKQYALMGDSTFFWRGMTAISNSIKEGQDILYIILEKKNTRREKQDHRQTRLHPTRNLHQHIPGSMRKLSRMHQEYGLSWTNNNRH